MLKPVALYPDPVRTNGVLVMCEGRLVGELSAAEADEQQVMALATGVQEQAS